jgi:hypothetical protein
MSPPRDTLVFIRGEVEPSRLCLDPDSGDSINASVVGPSGEVRAEKWFWGWEPEAILREMLAMLPPDVAVVGIVRAGWLFSVGSGFDANGSPVEDPAWPMVGALPWL